MRLRPESAIKVATAVAAVAIAVAAVAIVAALFYRHNQRSAADERDALQHRFDDWCDQVRSELALARATVTSNHDRAAEFAAAAAGYLSPCRHDDGHAGQNLILALTDNNPDALKAALDEVLEGW